jgi:acyl carrier protein
MTTETPIAARIRTALAEYLKRDTSSVALSHSLRDDLGLDSMATIELLFRIEEAFDIQIPDEDLRGLATVADVSAYVEKRLQKTAPSAPRPQAKSRKKRKG